MSLSLSYKPLMHFGAWIDTHYTGGKPPADMTAQAKFDLLSGKNASICPFGHSLDSSDATVAELAAIRQAGYIPFLNMGFAAPHPAMCSYIAAGNYDAAIIKGFVNPVLAFNQPCFIRTLWEMNGNWYQWGAATNGNTPGKYVAAWKRIVNLFRAAGATNVSWVWCPNVDQPGLGVSLDSLALLYPGDDYVDWVAMDGYAKQDSTLSPTQVFGATYDHLSTVIAPTKPMMICEAGTIEQTTTGLTKAQWIAGLFSAITTRMPLLKALMYYDTDDGANAAYQLNSTPASAAAWAKGITDGNFASNSFAALQGGIA